MRTLFFGGGTPSLLEPAEILSLSDALRRAFVLRPREVTLEANPATLDRARLEAWQALGLTRLSLGAQSFDAQGLRALGRTHQAEDSASAVRAARDAGLDVNLDLIFGWPGQTIAAWERLERHRLGPDHSPVPPGAAARSRRVRPELAGRRMAGHRALAAGSGRSAAQ